MTEMAWISAAELAHAVRQRRLSPVGLQLIGRPRDDAGLFRAAASFVRARPWSDRRPVP
jgi:Asp-tRNA(Asn)/Glu-tRNA(Gln) amidotransferase A subunit family amidase